MVTGLEQEQRTLAAECPVLTAARFRFSSRVIFPAPFPGQEMSHRGAHDSAADSHHVGSFSHGRQPPGFKRNGHTVSVEMGLAKPF